MSEELKNVDPIGAFTSSLKRNNSKIRADRAEDIAENAELVYKREVEDIEATVKKMIRDRNYMLDLSPTNSQSLILASDFDEKKYVQKDLDLSVNIRNESIKLEIAKERFLFLFGKKL